MDTGTLAKDAQFNDFGLNGSLSLGGGGDRARVNASRDINIKTVSQRSISLWFFADDTSPTKKQVLFEKAAAYADSIYISATTSSLSVAGTPRRTRPVGRARSWTHR